MNNPHAGHNTLIEETKFFVKLTKNILTDENPDVIIRITTHADNPVLHTLEGAYPAQNKLSVLGSCNQSGYQNIKDTMIIFMLTFDNQNKRISVQSQFIES